MTGNESESAKGSVNENERGSVNERGSAREIGSANGRGNESANGSANESGSGNVKHGKGSVTAIGTGSGRNHEDKSVSMLVRVKKRMKPRTRKSLSGKLGKRKRSTRNGCGAGRQEKGERSRIWIRSVRKIG